MFSIPGMGATTYNNRILGFTEDPAYTAYRNQLNSLRNSILSGLGVTSPQREASLNQWADTYTKEALRTSMPQLEQTLFARGLGGSRFYGDQVTDLLSKTAAQATLNREELANRDEQLKLRQLESITGLSQTEIKNLMDILGTTASNKDMEEKLYQSYYFNTLPYLAKYNTGSNKGGMWGSLGASALALGLAPFTGGASLAYLPMAAGAGGTIGNLFDPSGQNSALNLNWLSMLPSSTPQYANIAGMGRVPIAPANYYLKGGKGGTSSIFGGK
jgi:hypothetical protein